GSGHRVHDEVYLERRRDQMPGDPRVEDRQVPAALEHDDGVIDHVVQLWQLLGQAIGLESRQAARGRHLTLQPTDACEAVTKRPGQLSCGITLPTPDVTADRNVPHSAPSARTNRTSLPR